MMEPKKHPNEWKFQILHHHTKKEEALNQGYPSLVCSDFLDPESPQVVYSLGSW